MTAVARGCVPQIGFSEGAQSVLYVVKPDTSPSATLAAPRVPGRAVRGLI